MFRAIGKWLLGNTFIYETKNSIRACYGNYNHRHYFFFIDIFEYRFFTKISKDMVEILGYILRYCNPDHLDHRSDNPERHRQNIWQQGAAKLTIG